VQEYNDLLPGDYEPVTSKEAQAGYNLQCFVSITHLGSLFSRPLQSIKVVFKLTVWVKLR